MTERVRQRHTYRDHNGRTSICFIEVIDLADQTIAIATEVPDNKGSSIGVACAILIADVVTRYKIDQRTLVWIEHYPALGKLYLVNFASRKVNGKPLYTVERPVRRDMTADDWYELGLKPRRA